jgi:N-acyl-D-amino-acid deacylase
LDFLFSNAIVVDGTGQPRFHAAVGVESERITIIDRKNPVGFATPSERKIDASRMILCPGFVDIHTHSDFSLLQNGRAESSIRQGVTTAVIGACGRSCAPLREETKHLALKDVIAYDPEFKITWTDFAGYLDALEVESISQNVASLAAHNAIRIAVMGYEPRRATTGEMEEMKKLVEQCMRAGAFGLSTGLAYPPGAYASTEEIIELAKVAAKHGGIYWSHLRGSDGDFLAGVNEALLIGREAKIPVHMAHLCGFFWNPSDTEQALQLIRDARKSGMDVTCDLYPYLVGANPLISFLPAKMFDESWKEIVEYIKNPQNRSRIAREILKTELGSTWFAQRETLERIILFDCSDTGKNASFKGKTLAEISEIKRMSPVEAVLDLLADEGQGMYTLGVVVEWMNQKDNFAVFKQEFHMVGSDGIALAPYGKLASFRFHPRSYGTYPRVIAEYVRRKRILTLEEAIRKMTFLPAMRLGLSEERGMIREGHYADLVLFDYYVITDKSTFTNPTAYPEGIKMVMVNGEVVVEEGKHTGQRPGKIFRHQPMR